jgi:hypothetical protein
MPDPSELQNLQIFEVLNLFMCHRPPPKPAAEDSNRLRGKKRLERLQSLGMAGSNVCPSDAVSSDNSAVALRHLTPIGFNSYGE